MPTPVGGHKQYMTFNGLVLTTGLASDVKASMKGTEIDVSSIGQNWKDFVQGQADMTLTASGVWDSGTATTSLDSIMFANMNQGGTKLFEFDPAGSATGNIMYKGNGFLSSYEVGGAVGDKVGFSAAIRSSGSVTRTTSA